MPITQCNNCEIDPWFRGEKHYEYNKKQNRINIISTDKIIITKTTKLFPYSQKVPPNTSYTNLQKSVPFSHRIHNNKNISCETCHHKINNPRRLKKCAVCHHGYNGYTTMHTLCVGCHIKKKVNNIQCHQCHKK